MPTDSASVIKREVDRLIDLQIETMKQESPLTPAQLCEYHLRHEKIRTLYRELDRIEQAKVAVTLAAVS